MVGKDPGSAVRERRGHQVVQLPGHDPDDACRAGKLAVNAGRDRVSWRNLGGEEYDGGFRWNLPWEAGGQDITLYDGADGAEEARDIKSGSLPLNIAPPEPAYRASLTAASAALHSALTW